MSAESQRDLYATVLRNIANSAWNAGRAGDELMTAQEYAAETLRVSPPPGRPRRTVSPPERRTPHAT